MKETLSLAHITTGVISQNRVPKSVLLLTLRTTKQEPLHWLQRSSNIVDGHIQLFCQSKACAFTEIGDSNDPFLNKLHNPDG